MALSELTVKQRTCDNCLWLRVYKTTDDPCERCLPNGSSIDEPSPAGPEWKEDTEYRLSRAEARIAELEGAKCVQWPQPCMVAEMERERDELRYEVEDCRTSSG